MTKFKKILLSILAVGALFTLASVAYADNPNFWLLNNNFIQPLNSSWKFKAGNVASTSPVGSNGAIVYDTLTNKFRCYENGAWANCVGGGGGSVAGSPGQVQYNNAGSFGGSASLLTNGTVTGINATSSTVGLLVQGPAGAFDPFQVTSSTGTSLLVVKQSGNVGIGVSSPTQGTLQIHNATAPGVMLAMENNGGSGSTWGIGFGTEATPNLYVGDSTAINSKYFWRANYNTANVAVNTFETANSNGNALTIAEILRRNAGDTGDYLHITSNGGTTGNLFTVNSSGNVGIGTSTPTASLHVQGTGSTNPLQISSSTGASMLSIAPTNNVILGTNSSVSSANPLNVSFGGTFGSNAAGNKANLKWDLFNDGSGNRYGIGMSSGLMEFQAGTAAGHAFYVSQGTEVMRITSGANVGIGTTTPAAKLDVYGSGTTNPFNVSSSSKVSIFKVTSAGNVSYNGTAITCGTNCASVVGVSTNNAGRIVVSGGVITSAVINFANGGWTNTPSCWANDETGTIYTSASATPTTLTFNSAASVGAATINYGCKGLGE